MINQLYAPLGTDRRLNVRRVARDAFVYRFDRFRNARPSRADLKKHFRKKLLATGDYSGPFGSILLSLAISLAIKLFFYWLEKQIRERFEGVLPNHTSIPPAGDFRPGEPCGPRILPPEQRAKHERR